MLLPPEMAHCYTTSHIKSKSRPLLRLSKSLGRREPLLLSVFLLIQLIVESNTNSLINREQAREVHINSFHSAPDSRLRYINQVSTLHYNSKATWFLEHRRHIKKIQIITSLFIQPKQGNFTHICRRQYASRRHQNLLHGCCTG